MDPHKSDSVILDRVCSTMLLFQKLIQAMPLTAEVVGEPGAAISVLLALPMRNQTWDSGHFWTFELLLAFLVDFNMQISTTDSLSISIHPVLQSH